MLSLTHNARIYVHVPPTDLRKSFDGLMGLVRSEFGRDPREGSLFVFFNKRRDRVKLMWWDVDGYALLYKRLESGTFEMLKPRAGAATFELDATELSLLLSGITLSSAHRRKRFTASA